MMRRIFLTAALVAALATSGCSGLSDTEQRAGTGTAIGAGAGAVVGAIAGHTLTGAVIGAGAGLVGGLLVDKSEKDKEAAYQKGYEAGQQAQ
jgi:osmotically inducible lipoprotein OsmB